MADGLLAGRMWEFPENRTHGASLDKKIVIGCASVPGMGGANTASYKLFELMQREGLDMAYLNIISEDEEEYFRFVFGENYGNPKALPDVHNCVLRRAPCYPSPRHEEVVGLLRELKADVHLGIDFNAALIMKKSAPEIPLIFQTTGCDQLKTLLAQGKTSSFVSFSQEMARQRSEKSLPPSIVHRREEQAVSASDLVLTNSDIIKQLYEYFFPSHTGKILSQVIWFTEWICRDAMDYAHLRRPFDEREIDVLFVANLWTRAEKNVKFLKKLLRKSRDLHVHVVGDIEEKDGKAAFHGFLTDRSKLFALMGNAKAVVSVSSFDSAPGALFEGAVMGCNVVSSKNCGNWRLCHADLLVDPLEVGNFVEKLRLSVAKKLDDNLVQFLQVPSYRNLLDTIEVFDLG